MEELIKQHCSPLNANSHRLSDTEIKQLLSKLSSWEVYEEKGDLRLGKSFKFKDFRQAIAFVNKVAELANEEDHHPAILTEWGKVTVTWWTHSIKGLHMNDFIMAAKTEHIF